MIFDHKDDLAKGCTAIHYAVKINILPIYCVR